MHFEIIAKDNTTSARTGKLHTVHGVVNTPAFIPVGTSGTVKGVHLRELTDDIRAQIMLANTYHLYLRPGTEVIGRAGGVHTFINWKKPMLTDSGGFQIYSLNDIRKISDEGVEFSSHIDGSKHFFSPEFAVDVQRKLGADIIMAFDECVAYPCEYSDARKAMERTHSWLDRSVTRFRETTDLYGYEQSLFPIVQGSVYEDLRTESAQYVQKYDAPGYAIGGLSVGEPAEKIYEMTGHVCQLLPKNRLRYLMGVGTPVNLLECIDRGVDIFDCVMPTRNARNGMLFTKKGIIHLKNEKWKFDFSPIDPDGDSYVDQHYSRAYLRHLSKINERLAAQIASVHNLRFYHWLMEEARKNINDGNFMQWKNGMVKVLGDVYETHPTQ